MTTCVTTVSNDFVRDCQACTHLAFGFLLTALSLCDASTLTLSPAALFREVKKGPLTCGHKGGEKWSRTTIHREVMVPYVVRNGPNTHPLMDTYPPIYWPVDLSRSILTLTLNPPTGQTKSQGRIRSISTSTVNPPTENQGQSLIVD